MPLRIGRVLAGAGLLFILATTLVPLPEQSIASRLTPWWCLVCGDHGGVDVINNVFLFVPFALGLRLAGVRTRTAVAVGALLSLSIELLQWRVVPGRDASLSDVLTNTSGSWLGAAVGAYHRRLLYPGATEARLLALAGAFLWLTTQVGSAALLQPWAPAQDLRGIWSRSVHGRPPFDGRVIEAELAGEPLPSESLPVSPELARRIRKGQFDLDARLLSGRSGGRAPVVEVLGPGGAVVAVEASGPDLAFQPPMRSALLRLGRPSLRLPNALTGQPGSEVQLRARDRGSTLWAQWTVGGKQYRAVQSLSPSFGWSLLTPFRYAYGPEARFITMLWLAAWLLPVGYWTDSAPAARRWKWGALVLLVTCGLALIPALMGYNSVSRSEWIAALLGLVAGGAGHRFAAYLERRCDSPSIKESC
jgi:hypothetical protein